METSNALRTTAIDMTAVELHRPPDETIKELEARAAHYERSFLTQESEYREPTPEYLCRALGWVATRTT